MRSIITTGQPDNGSLVVVPPKGAVVPPVFRLVKAEKQMREDLLSAMQRFRGGVYLHDGAILPQDLTGDGRHQQAADDQSWHVLALDDRGAVCACLRFLEERVSSRFEHLWVRHAALSQSPTWGKALRAAVESEMSRAVCERIRFGEVGGWAISPERRLTIEPLRIILATYGLLQLLGGCSGVATATRRHNSAGILRKIGLRPLVQNGEELPAYYDPRYRCEMEVLQFDSRCPNPKFQNWIQELSDHLTTAPVICDRVPAKAKDELEPLPALALVPSF